MTCPWSRLRSDQVWTVLKCINLTVNAQWNAYLHRIDVVDSDMGSDVNQTACFDRRIVIFVETAAGSVSHAERLCYSLILIGGDRGSRKWNSQHASVKLRTFARSLSRWMDGVMRFLVPRLVKMRQTRRINVAAALRSHLCLSARSQSVRLFLFWHVRHRYSGQESHFRHSTQRYRKDNVIFDARQNQSAISFSSVFVNKTGGFKVPSKIPNSVLSTDCSISIKSSNQVLSEASTSISQFVDARFPDETDFGSSLRMDMELEEGYGNPGQGLGKWCSRVTTPKILLVEEIKR